MVFPSLLFNVEPGVVSQFSGFFLLAFSFLIHRAKKWVVVGILALSSFLILHNKAHAMVASPGMTYPLVSPYPGFPMNPYMTNFNYYGQPWGQVPPLYFYPTLPPYMGMYPQNYFMPHTPSPYGPGNFCPTCNLNNPYPPQPVPYNPNTPVS